MPTLPLLKILLWLKNNWLPIAIAAVAVGIYFYGAHNGRMSERAACNQQIQEERDARQAAKDKLQDDADQRAAIYEKQRAADQAQLRDVKRRLQDEKTKNAAFATCHAGDEFMRIYETSAGRAGAAGDSPR